MFGIKAILTVIQKKLVSRKFCHDESGEKTSHTRPLVVRGDLGSQAWRLAAEGGRDRVLSCGPKTGHTTEPRHRALGAGEAAGLGPLGDAPMAQGRDQPALWTSSIQIPEPNVR